MSFDNIKKDIQKQKFAPIYYLYGEETYFTDKITELVDKEAIELSQRDFNRAHLYASETNIGTILTEAKSFPIMADRRVVILKEAQNFSAKEWDKMKTYFQKPMKSTVLVLAFKGKGKKLPAALEKMLDKSGAVIFESKKLYEKDVRNWVLTFIMGEGFEMESGVEDLVVSNLGANLHLIENELEKIFIFLKAFGKNKLTKEIIYEMMNIDKEFNVFELVKALSTRNVAQSHLIIDKLAANTKLNPPIIIVNQLFQFMSNMATVWALKLSDAKAIQTELKMNWYAAQDYANAKRVYPLANVYRYISYILETDLMLKGIISTDMEDGHILKTLVWKILNQ
ncbi:MAG: DNA polymerase III subunit delta [Bacteroidia bacterium]